MAIRCDHPRLTVGDHELRSGKSETTLLVGDGECCVVDEVIENLARQLERSRFEDRYLRILLSVYACKAKTRPTGFHLYPFVLEFLEMDLATLEGANDVEEFAGLYAHRPGLLYFGFGIAADRHVEVGA